MKKDIIYIFSVLILLAVGFVGIKVFAQTSLNNETRPMIININPSGEALVRGIIIGTSTANSIIIKSWGVNWTIEVSTTTELITPNKSIADLQDGDFVGISGKINSAGGFEIDAKVIREWAKKIDHDKDGISDDQDQDDDNDGIDDDKDIKPKDHDNDSISDNLDSDDDNDGIEDNKDAKPEDHDNDSSIDSQDNDDDNDNIEDNKDIKPEDHDNDGIDDNNDSKDDSEDTGDNN